MIILSRNLINPHIKLHALSLPPLNQGSDTPIQRLNLLAKTRQFDAILKAADSLEGMSFPTLASKIPKAKEVSEKRKEQLRFNQHLQVLKELDEMSKVEDPNFQKIDQGQANMYELAKIFFEEGQYAICLNILKELEKQDVKEQLWLKITWARLYAEIILQNDAIKVLDSLKKKIEDIETEELAFLAKQKSNTAKLIKRLYAQKQQFLLLSLFAVFRKAGDEQLQKFVDYCTADKSYFSILQLTCPQLLRYVVVALVMNKAIQSNRSFDLFRLAEVINRKYVNYTDCFIEFISLLEIEYDFEAAADKIKECKEEIKKDIFLAPYEERIIEGLHFLYFRRACKIYETIELSQIASFTGLPPAQAELWILSYIRSGDIDAKIDSISEQLVSNKGRQNPNQKYLDVVPALGSLVSSLSRAINSQ